MEQSRKISEILALHRSFQAEHGHADILGDAYLLKNNPIYRNIKEQALKIGCQYQEAWPEYLLMPFHQLGQIVATKTIPYVPSARLLQKIEDTRANALSIDDLQIPESYHLHEAAHVVAEHAFNGYTFTDPQERILKAIVCESFANTVDALACASATDDTHRFFLKQNCYMHPDKKYVTVIAKLSKEFGEREAFFKTLTGYMHANFLRDWPVNKNLQPLKKLTDQLDPQFRVVTTKMYLNLEGFDGEVFELLNFSFMDVYEANPRFKAAADALSRVVCC